MELETKRPGQAMNPLSEADTSAHPSASRCILIVDDNQDAADSLSALLGLMGNEVHVAYDGLQALEMATALEPDVILMDIGLPKLNGYDAARQIRGIAALRSATLVALTGWGQGEDKRRSQEAGFDHHLVKPVGLEDLQAVLDCARLRPS